MKKRNLFKLLAISSTSITQEKSVKIRFLAFFRMLKTSKKLKYKIGIFNLIIALVAIIYFISPIDFIPEIAFGPFGIIDDFAILMFGLKFLNKEITNFINWENQLKTTVINP